MATDLRSSRPRKGAVAEAIEEFASVTGATTERIRPLNPEWAKVLGDALVIEVEVRTGSFEWPLGLEADLGVRLTPTERAELDGVITSHGRKLLVAKERLTRITSLQGAIRNILTRYAMKTRIIKHGRLMPMGAAECARCGAENLREPASLPDPKDKKKTIPNPDRTTPLAAHTRREHPGEEPLGKERGWWYAEWKAEHDRAAAQFLTEARKFSDDYDELYREGLAKAKRIGAAAYARLMRDSRNESESVTLEEFLEAQVERRFRRRFPTKQQIERQFGVDFSMTFIPLMSVLAEDEAKAREILVEQRADEIAARELAAAKTQVERDLIESRRAMIGQFADFVSDVEGSVRQTLYERCLDALAILDDNDGVLQNRSAEPLERVLKSMKALQMGMPDEELETAMRRIRTALALVPRDERSYQDAAAEVAFQNLERVAAQMRLALIEVGRPPANRREKLIQKIVLPDGRVQDTSFEYDYDPGERLGIPSSVGMLREMAAGRVRRVRGGEVEVAPVIDLRAGRQRRVRSDLKAAAK